MSWKIINTRRRINKLQKELKERKIFLDRFNIEYVEDFDVMIIYDKLDRLVGTLLDKYQNNYLWTKKAYQDCKEKIKRVYYK